VAVKNEERIVTIISLWKVRWSATSKGSETRIAIPDIGTSEGGSEKNYFESVSVLPLYMTQALTGHGYFQQYLLQMGRAVSDNSHHCDTKSDIADYTLFECPFWSGNRDELGHYLSSTDLSEILYGSEFEGLPADHDEKYCCPAEHRGNAPRSTKLKL